VAGDTTKLIPPPPRGPRWIDLALAAVAGALLTLLVIGGFVLGNVRSLAPASNAPSPTSSESASSSIAIRTSTPPPSTEAPTLAPTAAPTTAAPTTAPPTATSTPAGTTTLRPSPQPTKTP
jgi:cytoskeletal protein RodZ